LALVVVLGPVACFSEVKSDLPPGCSLGQHLCPCDGEQCDPGLTCSVSAEVCVALDCEVGALECPCGNGGACNPALVCGEYGYCVPEDGVAETGTDSLSTSASGSVSDSMSTSMTSDSMSTTDSMTSSTSVDPDTGTTDGPDSMSTTDSTTSTDDVTTNDTSVSLDLGSDVACDGILECSDCLECAQMNECAAIWAECTDAMQGIDAACVNGFMTYLSCTTQAPGEDDCNSCNGASELAVEFFGCLATVCDAPCTCL
jgi:hypothetical protein